MRANDGVGRIVAAIVIAAVAFCVVGAAVFYEAAGVGTEGLHGGPKALSAAMAALFGGGLVAVVVLVLVLRWTGVSGRRRES
jgi:hypothetical protein